jgi:hypothetical protein
MKELPGVARRQVTFLVLPRKVTKRRRARFSALRVPKSVNHHAAGKKTRFAQTVFARLPRLSLACLGASEGYATCKHRALNVKDSNFSTNSNASTKYPCNF